MKKTPHSASAQRGIALAETVLSMAVLALAANTVAWQVSSQFEQRSIGRAKQDLLGIESAVAKYRSVHHRLPDSLQQVGMRVPLDPWGRAYDYVPYGGSFVEQRTFDGLAINSEYDLCSHGPDGRSDPNLRADAARDDIVRARDGAFVGVASDF